MTPLSEEQQKKVEDEKNERSMSFMEYAQDFKYLIMWLVWLFVGMAYYSQQNHLEDSEKKMGAAKGFYMAVNIGYSIGWGYPLDTSTGSMWFSLIYVVIGASFVGLALGFFADKVVEDRDNWFVNAKQREEFESRMTPDMPWITRFAAYLEFENEKFKAIYLWLIWIIIMTIFALCEPISYNFTEALYFAVSSCSTGGHWSIPNDADDWVFGLTGFFGALGVPIMGVAMASLAQLMLPGDDISAARDTILEPVTQEELRMLEQYGLADKDGEIDKSEFIILSMVRLGNDPALVDLISQRFNELDDDKSGSLSVAEITVSSKSTISSTKAKSISSSSDQVAIEMPPTPPDMPTKTASTRR